MLEDYEILMIAFGAGMMFFSGHISYTSTRIRQLEEQVRRITGVSGRLHELETRDTHLRGAQRTLTEAEKAASHNAAVRHAVLLHRGETVVPEPGAKRYEDCCKGPVDTLPERIRRRHSLTKPGTMVGNPEYIGPPCVRGVIEEEDQKPAIRICEYCQGETKTNPCHLCGG